MPHALIIGASRGIGAEFVSQCLTDGWQVTATARSGEALAGLRGQGARAVALDVASAESASRLAWQIDGTAFDLVLLNAGMTEALNSVPINASNPNPGRQNRIYLAVLFALSAPEFLVQK